jgi:hypothetical protein
MFAGLQCLPRLDQKLVYAATVQVYDLNSPINDFDVISHLRQLPHLFDDQAGSGE